MGFTACRLNKTDVILDNKTSYTFSKYFELNFDAADVFAELGCTFVQKAIALPSFSEPIGFSDDLRRRLELALKVANITSEMARRVRFDRSHSVRDLRLR